MGRGLQGAMLRGFGGRDHLATVEYVEYIAPHCVRITMSSPTLFDDVDAGPTTWLRFWFPDPAGGKHRVPTRLHARLGRRRRRPLRHRRRAPRACRPSMHVGLDRRAGHHHSGGVAGILAVRRARGTPGGFSARRGGLGVHPGDQLDRCRAAPPRLTSRYTSNAIATTMNSSRSPNTRVGTCTG